MATKGKSQHRIELEPGQFATLQTIANRLGYVQSRGSQAGKVGSVSALMQAIAAGEVTIEETDDYNDFIFAFQERMNDDS
jgi:hypothetical protein